MNVLEYRSKVGLFAKKILRLLHKNESVKKLYKFKVTVKENIQN